MPKMLTQAEMKARRAEVDQLIAAAEKEICPLQAERDAFQAKFEPTLQAMNKKLKELNVKHKLYDLKMELSSLVKAMKQ